MSDLRDFNTSNDSDIGRTRIEPPLSQSALLESSFDRPEPLGEFHTIETEEPSNTGRIVGGLVVALMLGSAAVYGFEVSNHPARPVSTQTAVNTPAPAPAPAPVQSADATPAMPAPSDTASSSVTPPVMVPAPAVTTPAPMKKAPVRSARVDSTTDNSPTANSAPVSNQAAASAQPAPVDSSSTQAQQQASSAGTPEQGAVQPVYPTAPSSSLATNNVQPVVPSDVPQPQVQSTPVPAPDQAAQPAPDQSQAAQPSPDQSGQPVQ